MLFSSTAFLFLFLPLTIILYYNPCFKGRKYRNILLLAVSLFFYAWGEPVFVMLMIVSILITYFIGIAIGNMVSTPPILLNSAVHAGSDDLSTSCEADASGSKVFHSKRSKILLTAAIVYHVAILFIFKYLSFISSQFCLLLHSSSDNAIDISLPIGISFFTFQLMSYLFDVYYGKTKAQKNVLYLGLYISFFPQLIAGPIVRYSDVADQIENRVESSELFSSGMQRFIYGLAKKVLIADYVAVIADVAFANIDSISVTMAWLGALCYTLQIYFDFSGYSDMAIGLGRMFGFKFMENFNYPYISKSITEFWRRWHISLSSWFRDYVYIPLGGNRCKKSRWILNLFVVWLLTGIWHGANWTFVIWGFVYFAFLLTEKLTGIDQKLGCASYLTTALVVVLNWVIFRADSLSDAVKYLGTMFGTNIQNGFVEEFFTSCISSAIPLLVISLIGITPILKKLFAALEQKHAGWVENIWLILIFMLSLIHCVSSTYSPFIYFNF